MSSTLPIPATGSLQTEWRSDNSMDIDIVSTLDMCHIMNAADLTVAPAVTTCIPQIARAIDLITEKVGQGGRIIYIGAGTSGRLGILDASEIPPTFSAPYSQFIGLISGGDVAVRRAVEGAEDSTTRPLIDLDAISPPLDSLDTLIGIAASGRTPYVLAGMAYCRLSLRMLTIGISCVQPSAMQAHADCSIECVVGPEIVTGSTRMKAGTATKLILNMISTGVMIRIGKTHGNLMVDLKTANNKLVDRSRRIFKILLPDSLLTNDQIDAAIASCDGSLKLALVVEKFGCSIEEARTELDKAGGILKKAWNKVNLSISDSSALPAESPAFPLVLCIDAGGTKCAVVIASKDGIQARAETGPCNFATLGHDAALSTISTAIMRALALLPESLFHRKLDLRLPHTRPVFAAVWLGGAGLDRPTDIASVHARLLKLLALSDPMTLLVTNDAALLSTAIFGHDHKLQAGANTSRHTKTGVVLIAGTGSIAYSFSVIAKERKLVITPLERSGGWGYLLGDEGSAFFVGREAIRRSLRHCDLGLPPTNLHMAVAAHFGCDAIGGILSAAYDSSSNSEPKLRISALCPIIFKAAFPEPELGSPISALQSDTEALEIVQLAATAAVDMVMPLLRDKAQLTSEGSTLVLGGSLAQVVPYKELIVRNLRLRGEVFENIEVVTDVAGSAIRLLANNFLAISP